MKKQTEHAGGVQAAVEDYLRSGRGGRQQGKRAAFRRQRAAGLVPLFAAEAKERQTAAGAHGKEGGRGKAKNPPGNPAPRVSDPAPRARDEAGAAVGVSGRKPGGAS